MKAGPKTMREPKRPKKPERATKYEYICDIYDYETTLLWLVEKAASIGVDVKHAIIRTEYDYDHVSVELGYIRPESDAEMAKKMRNYEKACERYEERYAKWREARSIIRANSDHIVGVNNMVPTDKDADK